MAASKESSEYHLTPSGWRGGTTILDASVPRIVPTPADRVVTCLYREVMSSSSSPMSRFVDEVWRSPDAAAVEALLAKFGPCPRELAIE